MEVPHIHILGFPPYTFLMFLGVVSYVTYLIVTMKKEGIDRVTKNRLLFVSVLGFVVLGASAFVMNSIFHSIEQGKLVIGGITWLGGVIGCIPATVYMIHALVPKEKGNALNRFSTLMPGLIIGHAFGRIGCFFGGCCFGGQTDSFLGVRYWEGSAAAKLYPSNPDFIAGVEGATTGLSLPVFPTQLVEAIFEILLFVVILILYKRVKHYCIEIYCFAYGAFRFAIEFVRGDNRGSTGFFLSPSQFICVLMWVAAVLLILYRRGIIFKGIAKKCAAWREAAAKIETSGGGFFASNTQKTADAIRELHKLKEEGILTEEEFNQKKAELLKRL